MADYRIFVLNASRRIAGPAIVVSYETDDEAISHARTCVDGSGLQLWCGNRLVVELPGQPTKLLETPNEPPSSSRDAVSPEEAAERAANLEAEAASMPAGQAQREILLQAHSCRALAMMKTFLTPAKG